jgi:hypothetical protein
VDSAGNVYIADAGNDAIEEWTPASNTVTTLVSLGSSLISGVAVDGAGNVYIADADNLEIEKWTAAGNSLTTLVSNGLNQPYGLAVDATANIYIADADNDAIKELPSAFVNPGPKLEGLAAGGDTLPTVLPASENLLPPFAPTSDQSWLAIAGITNGVVDFSFTADTGAARTANLTLLGQAIPIAQVQETNGVSPRITQVQMLGDGVLQLAFSNTLGGSFTVLSTTNLALPVTQWTVVGTATNTAPGQFQFTSQPTPNSPQRYYILHSP